MDCGCGTRDPFVCRCDQRPVTENYVDGYRDAVVRLMSHNLTPAPDLAAIRVLWRRGGQDQRLAVRLAELWEVAA